MDDLYDDLENYNDVNAVEELRIENKELKIKVEEYAKTVQQIQKNILQDFDKIASEYKRLELNYSSLLKTARAEIERKTLIITNLNIEKDTIVIQSLKKGRNVLKKNVVKGKAKKAETFQNIKKTQTNDSQKAKPDNGKKNNRTKPETKPSPMSPKKIKLEKCDTPLSEESATKQKTPVDSKLGENKEKIGDKLSFKFKNKDATVPTAQKLRNRRKSMPVLGKNFDKFSTDEECNENLQDNTSEEVIRRFLEKDFDRNKISESSSIEERNFNRYDHRESYRSRLSNDRYRSNHEHQHRRRNVSPDRYKPPRDNSGNRRFYGRYRAIESPPPDRYTERRYQELRQYDRDYSDYEHSRYRHSDRDRSAGKHKYDREDYNDEPITKRSRLDHKHQDDRKCHSDREPVEVLKNLENVQDFEHSCQSPDYSDNMFATQPIREIKHTAVTQLDDPRMTSNKYVKSSDSKPIPSALVGKDVDLKYIKPSTWGLGHVKDHKTSKSLQKPEIDEIYGDIEFGPSFSPEIPDIDDFDINELHTAHCENRTEPKEIRDITTIEKTDKISELPVSVNDTNVNKTSPVSIIDHKSIKVRPADGHSLTKVELGHKSTEEPNKNDKVPNVQPDVKLCKMLSNRNMVEGDLELSDEETNDVDFQKHVVKEIQSTEPHLQKKPAERYIEELEGNNMDNKDKTTDNSINKPNEETNIKKEKSKRKSHRNKSKKESVKTDDSLSETKAKTRKDKNKPQEIKTKFSELFGDSSSLITPEDLGVVTQVKSSAYMSVSEDAQDVSDITIVKNNVDESKTDETIENTVIDNIEEKTKKDKTKVDTELKSPEELPIDNVKTVIPECQPIIAEVVPMEISNEPVIQTIPPVDTTTEISVVVDSLNKNVEIKAPNIPITAETISPPIAIATSTPAKQPGDYHNGFSTEPLKFNGNHIPQFVSTIEGTLSVSALDSQPETDIPDVRIVVKRRRKVSKKGAPK